MRHNISVRVPDKVELSYTLFAQGLKTEIQSAGENELFYTFRFLGGTAVALFYTFAEFRRAYLVTEWESEKDGDKIFLPGIDTPLCLLYKAKGRNVDRLKSAIRWLTADDEYGPFRLPLEFWQRLSKLVDGGRGTKKDVAYLYDKFMEGRK